jgi:hypothetical protein
MYPTTRSAALFLERCGITPTRRHPVPGQMPAENAVHDYPLGPLYPTPDQLRPTQGYPPPDRGQTEVWPHGDPDA